jgi:ATP-binding cassette subfamily B protein
MSRATNDIDNIATALQTSFAECVSALVTIIGVIIMMLTTDVLITLICVVTIPLGTLITMAIVRSSQKHFSRQANLLGQINADVEECFSGHRIIKAFGMEKKKSRNFFEKCGLYKDSASRAQFASGFTYPLTSLVNELAFIGICLVGGLKVLSGSMLLGDVQALIQYSQKVSNPVTQVTNMISILQTTVASAERVFELLDEPEEPSKGTYDLPEKINGAVDFDNVCFRYEEDAPLIENFTLHVKPGQTAAIVGHTGAGKTTLVNLLMGFYRPQKGSITIDGFDINSVTRDSLHRHMAMVLQDTWLFDGTIAENIAYGAPEPEKVTREQIVKAAQIAMADSFIRALPEGYETILSETTSSLSQGQRQLLTIARAVLAQPDILILDEATSSVDTRTEKAIQTAMEHLMAGRTCFIIAHRLSTIRSAELIIVMDEGHIAEMGNHQQLLEKHGVYSQLYSSQN